MFIHKTILVRVVTEPLTHFLIIGILLFVGYEFTQQKPTMTGANNEIQISGIEVDSVKQIFRKRWQRDPEPTEIGPQIENLVREGTVSGSPETEYGPRYSCHPPLPGDRIRRHGL
jgi:hypothetical protein